MSALLAFVCVLWAYLVPSKATGRYWVPWNWSYDDPEPPRGSRVLTRVLQESSALEKRAISPMPQLLLFMRERSFSCLKAYHFEAYNLKALSAFTELHNHQ